MKKRHPLSTVLRLRHLAEEQEERLLERILLENARIEELARKEHQLILDIYRARKTSGKIVSASEVQALYAEVSESGERLSKFEEQKNKLNDLADQQRVALQKARQQRETVDSLIDKHREQTELCERRREQRELDDIHGAQRLRRQRSAASTRISK